MNPMTVAIVLSAAAVVAGIVIVCAGRIKASSRTSFEDMPVQVITFPKAQENETEDEAEDEEPEEEETFFSGKVTNDIIKNAEKNKVLASPCILEYSDDNGFGYLNNCVFLGDSRTVGMVNYKVVSDEDALAKVGLNHTEAARTTFTQNSGKSYTIKQFLQAKKSDVVYVCYGVNGMDSIPEEKYEETYTELVDDIIEWAPKSTVVLMAIWPVDDNGVYRGKVKNEWVDKYNDFLMKLAEEKHIKYLDIDTVLKNDKGSIKPEYDGGDGLHYSASAYGIILDYIVTHPVPGVSCEGEYKVHYVKPKGGGNTIPKAPAATPAVTPAVPQIPEAGQDPGALIPQDPTEEEKKKQEEEEQKRREEEEEEERKRQEEEEQKRKQEEEQQKKKQEEERKRQEEEERKRQEEEERKRQEEEERQRQEEEERRRQEEEEERRRQEEEEKKKQEEEQQNPEEQQGSEGET
ncbi:MAG: SGNH/GDSL hydrolase family protein [Lachnospiraceae bacterium]|nr:SGNH/GDSL hydrolase family protein [Lachnospiraceae bacterium]